MVTTTLGTMNDEPPVRDRAATLRNSPAVNVSSGQYGLLVVVNGVVTTHPLPETGQVVIGRARESDIQIVDASVSRSHARLALGYPMTIEDLGSANGTRVRGEYVAANQPVSIPVGEAMEMGGAMVMVQQRPAATREWRIWAHGYFEGRLEDECARAARANSSFGLLRVQPDQTESGDVVEQVLANILRADDVVGFYGPGQYEVLLVDRGAGECRRVKNRVKDALHDAGIASVLGLAVFPDEGRTADLLAQRAGANARGDRAPDRQPGSIVIKSKAMRQLVDLVERVAPGDISVLILGETGVGKEVMAEEVHRQSPRRDKPFLRLNCAALSETLLESELFGHERGSFTGANQAKAGLLETAQGGTVFLDEIGELPMSVQVKLLRVLEERKVWRVGGIRPRDIDVRFVAATNRNLEQAIQQHTFRQDLYFRLNGIALAIPPLRERREEIADMAKAFIAQIAAHQGRWEVPRLTDGALDLMLNYSWPGNVRELRNAIERAVLLAGNGDISPEHFAVEKMSATVSTPLGAPSNTVEVHGARYVQAPEEPTSETALPPSLNVKNATPVDNNIPLADRLRQQVKEVERQHIIDALARCGGNQTRAAKELGISRRTFISRLEAYNIPRPLKDRR